MLWALEKTIDKAIEDEFSKKFFKACISDSRFQQTVEFTESEAKKLVNYATATGNAASYKRAALNVAARKIGTFIRGSVRLYV